MGGGTTKVGDPSGKDETRKLLTHDDIQANIATQKQAFAEVPDGSATARPTPSWSTTTSGCRSSATSTSCATTASTSPINRMLAFDSVKLRLDREQPLTFIEFNYMLMQATGLPGAEPPLRLRAADGRFGPVGATSSTAWS
jgi:tyrosyl-tRNA synthetase